MKKILFVVNTLGRGGAERALVDLLSAMDFASYEVSLYVLTGQGELIHEIPDQVKIVNHVFDDTPVLGEKGYRKLIRRLLRSSFRSGAFFRRIPYFFINAIKMVHTHTFSAEKLARCLMADSAEKLADTFDLAVAFLEGGASMYVASRVKAEKKAAFIHVDYQKAGYYRELEDNCYAAYDRIFAVSEEVKKSFLAVYPECGEKTSVFHNIMNRERILRLAKESCGFSDGYPGFRIVTLGRLEEQKALELSMEALALLKKDGIKARWYVLGEGSERKKLEDKITTFHLEGDFLLMGAVENPYPYLAAADLYVHASRFEGKSIAVQEAQVLGKPIIVSDCSGNREQVEDGKDGLFCELSPKGICQAVETLYRNPELRKMLGEHAGKKAQTSGEELKKLYDLLETRG